MCSLWLSSSSQCLLWQVITGGAESSVRHWAVNGDTITSVPSSLTHVFALAHNSTAPQYEVCVCVCVCVCDLVLHDLFSGTSCRWRLCWYQCLHQSWLQSFLSYNICAFMKFIRPSISDTRLLVYLHLTSHRLQLLPVISSAIWGVTAIIKALKFMLTLT